MKAFRDGPATPDEAATKAATATPATMPAMKTADSTFPTSVPAIVLVGRTANAAGATTAAVISAAPSHAAMASIPT